MTEDRVEVARERVSECKRLINELLEEYNCYLFYARDIGEVIIADDATSPSLSSEVLDQ